MGRTRARRLNGATLMQSSLCHNVGFMRSFWRLKDAEICAHAFVDNLSHKTTGMPYHAKQSSRAGALGRALVFGVHTPTDLAQVRKGIVGLIAVYVVNLLSRPFSSNVQKSELVRHRTKTVKHDINVAISSHRTGRHTEFFASLRLQVSKLTGFWAVVRKFAQSLLSNHVAPNQSGKPSKVAASGDESPVPRQVSCITILRAYVAKSSKCEKIKPLSSKSCQRLALHRSAT